MIGPASELLQSLWLDASLTGWGGRIRTSECRNQNPVPYHLATPQKSDVEPGNAEGRGPY